MLVLLSGFVFCLNAQPTLFKNTDSKRMDVWVDSIFKSLTLDEKIGQLFMIVATPDASYQEKVLKNISQQKIGGILFSSGTLKEQAENTNLYQENSRVPLFISFDGEWGLAMRLKDAPQFPRNMTIGAIQDNELVRKYGEEVSRQCREMNVQINFAPVLDVNNNPKNPVIGVRAFGEKEQLVAGKGIAYARGLEKNSVLAVGKHFPGHGDTSEDSHKTLPRISHDREHLYNVELHPFVRFIQAGFSGIMTGHLSVPALDNSSGLPTSLSPVIVNDLLKNEYGFQGLAFTDALVMSGVGSVKKHSVCVQALLAGNDVLLSPGNPISEFSAVKKAVEDGVISLETINEKCRKILQYKYITGLNNYKPIQIEGLKNRINTIQTEWLIQKLSNESVTLLKNEEEKIPLKKIGAKKIAVLSWGAGKETVFQKHFSLYGDFDYFCLPSGGDAATIFKKLKNYDVIVCGIHNGRLAENADLQSLVREKEVHLCFFIPPYSLTKFRNAIPLAQSVTLAYEDLDAPQKAATEILMGGIPAKGKLPVTISDLFSFGTGMETEKTRLSYQNPIEEKMSVSTLDSIEQIVTEGINERAFPGCQVLVAKDGVVVYNKTFGYFDYSKKRAVTPADIYDLASVTKAMATVPAIMKLYDNQQLSLTNRASRFISELKDTDKSQITIENLLFHESRLPAFAPFYNLLIDKNSYSGKLYAFQKDTIFHIQYDGRTYFRSDFKFQPEKVSSKSQAGFSRKAATDFYVYDDFDKEVINEIAQSSLRKKAGYLYSDLNFILLKEIVERISKQSFDTFLEENFFSNLGANYTGFNPLKKIKTRDIAPTEDDQVFRKQLLIGYPHDETAALLGGVSGHAGLFSNANDLAKVAQMILDDGKYGGEQYLNKSTVDLFVQAKSKTSRRGLGFDKPDPAPGKGSAGELAPVSNIGHTGYTGTCFWIDPDNRLIFIFLSNRVHPSRLHAKLMEMNIRSRIHDVIYRSLNDSENKKTKPFYL